MNKKITEVVFFFPVAKQQKGGKKEMKIQGRQKMLEDEAALTPQKSRLPLRSQN